MEKSLLRVKSTAGWVPNVMITQEQKFFWSTGISEYNGATLSVAMSFLKLISSTFISCCIWNKYLCLLCVFGFVNKIILKIKGKKKQRSGGLQLLLFDFRIQSLPCTKLVFPLQCRKVSKYDQWNSSALWDLLFWRHICTMLSPCISYHVNFGFVNDIMSYMLYFKSWIWLSCVSERLIVNFCSFDVGLRLTSSMLLFYSVSYL